MYAPPRPRITLEVCQRVRHGRRQRVSCFVPLRTDQGDERATGDEGMGQQSVCAEVDEMWFFVKRKKEPRWLWHAIDHRSGKVLAYVFGRRQDKVFLKLQALLEPFGITRY
jgi:hypothetical protein